MRLAEAYRNLVRPSSELEPSHPPDGIIARTRFTTFS